MKLTLFSEEKSPSSVQVKLLYPSSIAFLEQFTAIGAFFNISSTMDIPLSRRSSHSLIKFKKPKLGTQQTYKINKVKISLEVHKNFKTILRNKISTIFGILDGAIVDKHGRKVLSYGDIVRTNDLKTLSQVFKIKKYLSVVKVL